MLQKSGEKLRKERLESNERIIIFDIVYNDGSRLERLYPYEYTFNPGL